MWKEARRKHRSSLSEASKDKVREYDRLRKRIARAHLWSEKTKSKRNRLISQTVYRLSKYLPSNADRRAAVIEKMAKQHGMTSMKNSEVATLVNSEEFKKISNALRKLQNMKRKRQIDKFLVYAQEVKLEFGTYRHMAETVGFSIRVVWRRFQRPTIRSTQYKELAELKRQEVESFCNQEDVTMVMAGMKHAGKRWLRETKEETYQRYRNSPNFQKHGMVSRSSFHRKTPKYIKPKSSIPKNECICDKCENAELQRNCLWNNGVKVPANLYRVVGATLCESDLKMYPTEEKFPLKDCVTRDCQKCGVQKFAEEIRRENVAEFAQNKMVWYYKWFHKDEKLPNGNKADMVQKVQIYDTLENVFSSFLHQLGSLALHQFYANWQRLQMVLTKAVLVRGLILQVMDFSQSWANRNQDEIQCAYWNSTQTAIFGTVTCFMCPNPLCDKMVTDEMFHISNTKTKDTHMIRNALADSIQYMVDNNVDINVIVQFADNCKAHFKSNRPFAELAKNPIRVCRMFFGEQHGKSLCDGSFGRLKRQISLLVNSREAVITDAYKFFEVCQNYLASESEPCPGKCMHQRYRFIYVDHENLVNEDENKAKTVPGTMGFHAVENTPRPLELRTRKVGCACLSCLSGESYTCKNKELVDPWEDITIKPDGGNHDKRPRHRNMTRNKHFAEDLQMKFSHLMYGMRPAYFVTFFSTL